MILPGYTNAMKDGIHQSQPSHHTAAAEPERRSTEHDQSLQVNNANGGLPFFHSDSDSAQGNVNNENSLKMQVPGGNHTPGDDRMDAGLQPLSADFFSGTLTPLGMMTSTPTSIAGGSSHAQTGDAQSNGHCATQAPSREEQQFNKNISGTQHSGQDAGLAQVEQRSEVSESDLPITPPNHLGSISLPTLSVPNAKAGIESVLHSPNHIESLIQTVWLDVTNRVTESESNLDRSSRVSLQQLEERLKNVLSSLTSAQGDSFRMLQSAFQQRQAIYNQIRILERAIAPLDEKLDKLVEAATNIAMATNAQAVCDSRNNRGKGGIGPVSAKSLEAKITGLETGVTKLQATCSENSAAVVIVSEQMKVNTTHTPTDDSYAVLISSLYRRH